LLACVLSAASFAAWGVDGFAYAQEWSVDAAKGTALRLNDDAWEEIAIGERVVDGGIYRTLRSGSIVLAGEGTLITLGSRTAIGIDLSPLGASVLHYAGTVTVAASDRASSPVRVSNTALTVSGRSATFTVFYDGSTGRVEVDRGTARVANLATGTEFTVAAGGVLSTASGDAAGNAVAGRSTRSSGNSWTGPATSGRAASGSDSSGNGNGGGPANGGAGDGIGSENSSGGNGNGIGSGNSSGNGGDGGNGNGTP
jgi:hypothetical protein